MCSWLDAKSVRDDNRFDLCVSFTTEAIGGRAVYTVYRYRCVKQIHEMCCMIRFDWKIKFLNNCLNLEFSVMSELSRRTIQ